MKLNNIFCIISAIGNDYGKFSYSERFHQLLETIESIKKHAEGSDIVLVDASEEPLKENDVKTLNSLVNKLIFLHDDPIISFLKNHSKDPTENKFEKKSAGEIQATKAFLNFLKIHPKKYKRVFKISGRYKLNENFKLSDYDDKINNCVLLNKEQWYDEFVFTLRLWSFDYQDLDKICDFFDAINNYTYNKLINSGVLTLVEVVFTKFIENMKIPYIIVDKVGLEGLSGLDGRKTYE